MARIWANELEKRDRVFMRKFKARVEIAILGADWYHAKRTAGREFAKLWERGLVKPAKMLLKGDRDRTRRLYVATRRGGAAGCLARCLELWTGPR
ncbi:hypothetical protein NBRC116601_10240 [Cognatishimia sp. WU-CL00825]